MNKRSGASYVTAVATFVLGLLAAAYYLLYHPVAPNLAGFSLVLLGVTLIYALYVAPSVEISGERVVVANPVFRYEVGIGAVSTVETKHQLTLFGDFGIIRAWGAPAPGRLTYRTKKAESLRSFGMELGDVIRPGDIPTSLCGSLALQIRRAKQTNPRDTSYKKQLNLATTMPFAFTLVLCAVLSQL